MCTASKTQKKKLQIIKNKALKFINYNEDDRPLTIEALHHKYDLKPINIKLHNKANRIWETIKETEPDHYNELTQSFNYKHTWFPKSSSVINSEPPEPIYTSQS